VQVTGFAQRKAVGRLLMAFQACIDESYSDDASYVLAGYIASAETWAKFAKDWEELLPLTFRAKQSGKYRFKMKEMARRMEKVPAFYTVIEKYDLIRLSCHFDLSDLERAKQRVWVENLRIDWGYTDNPYSFAFRCLMDMFHTHREKFNKLFPSGQKIDFVFDKRGESKAIIPMWDNYIKKRPDETREHYGANPRFEDDEEFMPLQAADFWAWWMRKWCLAGTSKKIESEDFGSWKAKKLPVGIAISFTEDQIVEAFISLIREGIEPGRPILDAKYHPRPTGA
jgi:Protein of unknown function (DUF3800)